MVDLKRLSWTMVPIYAMVFLAVIMAAVWTDNTVAAMSESRPLENRHCIIIDAGHGGLDGGATSCTGVLESHLNLEIALRLNDLFQLLGYNTQMIRTSDISVYTNGDTIAQKKISDLKQRVETVNGQEKGILVSIHQNNFNDSRYSGAQVFYSKAAKSEDLAKKMQRCLIDNLNPGSHRQAKQASGVYLMEHIQCTGVLIECGFLSNPEEEANLRSDEYQKKLSCVIAASVSRFLSP